MQWEVSIIFMTHCPGVLIIEPLIFTCTEMTPWEIRYLCHFSGVSSNHTHKSPAFFLETQKRLRIETFALRWKSTPIWNQTLSKSLNSRFLYHEWSPLILNPPTYAIFYVENRRRLWFNLIGTFTDSNQSISSSSYNKYQSCLLDLLSFSRKPWCSNYR